MIYFFTIILFTYIVSIMFLIYGFDKIKTSSNNFFEPNNKFSIIVPFRNEEQNFITLLNSISGLNYPKNLFEIIVVNDASDDNSVFIFNNWQLENIEISSRLLQNIRKSNSPKKDAIRTAILQINNTWIISTDADCVVHKNWLLAFDNFIQKNNVEMICGSVSINDKNGFLNYFQLVDLLSLQGTTIGSFGIKIPFMCNAANFAYTKKIFLELNGFDENDNIASGDDVFLLQKAIKFFPEKVTYLKNKEAIVFTKPEVTWSKLFNQRVRWASKTGFYNGFFGKFLAVIVLAVNLSIIFQILTFNFEFLFFYFIIKITIDLILINKTNKFFGNQKFILPIFSSLFYPFWCVVVAFYSFFGTFDWKHRTYLK